MQGSLDGMIRRDLPVQLMIDIVKGIASGMMYLHGNRCAYHRLRPRGHDRPSRSWNRFICRTIPLACCCPCCPVAPSHVRYYCMLHPCQADDPAPRPKAVEHSHQRSVPSQDHRCVRMWRRTTTPRSRSGACGADPCRLRHLAHHRRRRRRRLDDLRHAQMDRAGGTQERLGARYLSATAHRRYSRAP